VALVVSPDRSSIRQMSIGSDTRLDLPAGGAQFIVFGSSDSRPIRTLVNEPEADTDRDGLSDWLEQQLGTCPSRQGSAPNVDCARIADSRDTDGDALWDGWEVLGFQDGRTGQYLPLQTWGADPRHKDMFVEVDFRRLDQAENAANLSEKMSPASARELAAIFADSATTDPARRARHATSVGNPDGLPGISLHLDIGVPPELPADATIYGDWGGYSAVNAVPDPARPGSFVPAHSSGWHEQMAPVRHGIFRYILGYTSGGGACPFMSIACDLNFREVFLSAHELGHGLNVDHDGNPDIARPGCIPVYPSLMNYAGASQFSDGRDFGMLDDQALIETGAFSPNHELLDRLVSMFQYRVDRASGSVDWNRDGIFAPPGTRVRANASYAPNNSCENTRRNQVQIGLPSNRSPAIVRFNDHLWIFAVTPEKRLVHTSTRQPFACPDLRQCPTPSFQPLAERAVGEVDGIDAVTIRVGGRQTILAVGRRTDGSLFEISMTEGVGQFLWSGPNDLRASPATGEPSLAVSHDGRLVVLAYRGVDELVHYRFFTSAGWQDERTVIVAGAPLRMPPRASPAVAFARLRLPADIAAVTEHLIGAFIDRGVELYAFDGASATWSHFPAFLSDPLPEIGDPQNPRRAMGRPALAWVGAAPGQALPGNGASGASVTVPRLYVLYSELGQSDTHPVPHPMRMAMSTVGASGALRIGVDAYYDNVWGYAHGIDLLQPGEIALRAAETHVIKPLPGDEWNQVWFRPHSDGMAGPPYGNHDDWRMLGWGICASLTPHQAPRAACLPRFW
jgi:hypothetical protein